MQQSVLKSKKSATVLKNITDGAKNLKTVTIKYISQSGDVTVRETEPYEIKGGKYWGYDVDKNGIRQFNLERILETALTNNSFRPRWSIKIF